MQADNIVEDNAGDNEDAGINAAKEDAANEAAILDAVMDGDAAAEGGDKPVEEDPPAEEGQSISSMVDQGHVAQIMDMGFPKQVAEKALFLTQCKGVEKAMDWI